MADTDDFLKEIKRSDAKHDYNKIMNMLETNHINLTCDVVDALIKFKSRSVINYLFNEKYGASMIKAFNSDHLYTLLSIYIDGISEQNYHSRYYKYPSVYHQFIIDLIKANDLKPTITHLNHPKITRVVSYGTKENLILFLLDRVSPDTCFLEKMCLHGSYFVIEKVLQRKIPPNHKCFVNILNSNNNNNGYTGTYDKNEWFKYNKNDVYRVNNHYNTKQWKLELLIEYQYYPGPIDIDLMEKHNIALRDMQRFKYL